MDTQNHLHPCSNLAQQQQQQQQQQQEQQQQEQEQEQQQQLLLSAMSAVPKTAICRISVTHPHHSHARRSRCCAPIQT